jgi:hypothetical protein
MLSHADAPQGRCNLARTGEPPPVQTAARPTGTDPPPSLALASPAAHRIVQLAASAQRIRA